MTTQLLDSEIRYSRQTKDYDILICGAIVASAPNYSQAELIRSQILSERIQDGCYATATELDGGAVPDGTPADNFDNVPAGDGEPKRADSAVRTHLTFGHLRCDLFAPVYFCACGARATIVRYGDVDVYLCDRCHAAPDEQTEPWPDGSSALVNWSN